MNNEGRSKWGGLGRGKCGKGTGEAVCLLL